MNVFQESCCSSLAVLLLFLLQGSRADDAGVPVHKAVGDSLALIVDYPKEGLYVKWKYNGTNLAEYDKGQIERVDPRLFHERLKMNKDSISITVEDLKLQDSGIFSIVAENKSGQLPTKVFVLHVHGSRADDAGVPVHKAVGDSLALIVDYPKEGLDVKWKYNGADLAEYDKGQIKRADPRLFHERLKMNKDSISITVEDLKLQDSGIFSIVAANKSSQLPTKVFVLHVHDLIRDVQIESNHSWMKSNNTCTFHLRCQASGDPNPSYSWSGDSVTTGPNMIINVNLSERATLSCTANNTVSTKQTIKTVECRGKPEDSRFCVKIV